MARPGLSPFVDPNVQSFPRGEERRSFRKRHDRREYRFRLNRFSSYSSRITVASRRIAKLAVSVICAFVLCDVMVAARYLMQLWSDLMQNSVFSQCFLGLGLVQCHECGRIRRRRTLDQTMTIGNSRYLFPRLLYRFKMPISETVCSTASVSRIRGTFPLLLTCA